MIMTINAPSEAALRLPIAGRVLLLKRLWDSLADYESAVALSAEQDAELKRRMDRVSREGIRCMRWETVRVDLVRNAGR